MEEDGGVALRGLEMGETDRLAGEAHTPVGGTDSTEPRCKACPLIRATPKLLQNTRLR